MIELITGAALISLFHGLIPSHWLPMLALKSRYGWSNSYTLKIAFISAFSHVLSTVILGILLGLVSYSISDKVEVFTEWVTPAILIVLGLFFIWQHSRHHHFHLSGEEHLKAASPRKVIGILLVMMFLSPCLEIEALFISAGAIGWMAMLWVGLIYAIISCLGIVLWVAIAQKGLSKFNWHKLEHNSGLISGLILILVGLLSFFLH
jgi:putative Mn2+ efflux pump MntP